MKTISETRELNAFRRFELFEPVNYVSLTIEPGEVDQLTIVGPPEYVARVKSEVKGRTLKVSLGGSLSEKVKDALTTSLTRKSVRYYLIAKNLEEIKLTGFIRANLEAYEIKDQGRQLPGQFFSVRFAK